ncbi:hypothetical protein ETU08_09340 [Apibacter muscae]|uniref:hypothetical protein n=1 Tax=Apibacter muscae TaxID=2509004 RepID=UPI0011AC7BEF|nr:hypothetical protein [Apibacter muscae]TWP27915.1 hypothetical protein ETU08_09340 [Apibacter muscae]
MKNNRIFATLLILLFNLNLFSQIAINSNDPTDFESIQSASLSVYSKNPEYPILKISDFLNNNIFIINENGYVGLGKNVTPKVRLDLRGDSEGTIAVGNSNLDAVTAGAGAIRYNPLTSLIEYSNGLTWITMKKAPPKTNVLAVARPAGFTLIVPSDQPIKGWTIIRDITNSFNPTTGVFTAPDNGIYAVTARLLIKTINTPADASCELNIFYTDNGVAQGVKSVYPIIAPTSGIDIPVFNKTFLYLKAGDKVHVSFYSYLLNSPSISENDQLNYINIVKV